MIHNALGRPGGIARELVSEIRLENDSRIIALPNNHETIRGYSDCALLVLDEASRIPHSIIIATQPMILASRGDIIMLSTPAGQGNYFHECWADPNGNWTKIVARASDCPRFDPMQLAQMRRDFGPAMSAQEFDCEFLRDDQQVFATDSIDVMFDTDEEAITLPPLSRAVYKQR
jgi:hypothetical protein